jgi:hypothetical protein
MWEMRWKEDPAPKTSAETKNRRLIRLIKRDSEEIVFA